MEFLTILTIAALGIGALALILFPMWQQTRPAAFIPASGSPGQTIEEIEARYNAALAAIKDLMFDHEMGKISTEDYESILTRSKLEAAQLRHQLDRLAENPELSIDPALDAKIESLIRQARSTEAPTNGNQVMLNQINTTIKRLRTGRNGTATTCPICHAPFQSGDAFCSSCGNTLTGIENTTDLPACPHCRKVAQPEDAFCTECGTSLDPMVMLQYNEASAM